MEPHSLSVFSLSHLFEWPCTSTLISLAAMATGNSNEVIADQSLVFPLKECSHEFTAQKIKKKSNHHYI